MKAFICNSTVLGVAGYRPGLGFINVVFRFHSVAYREKKHRWIRSQIQCPFLAGTNLFSQLGSNVTHGRELNLSGQWQC